MWTTASRPYWVDSMPTPAHLPDGKLEKVQAICRQQGKEFEYAFLFDAFLEEQEQGITIDTARTFFMWKGRQYIIIDAPGHKEFLKNMISGRRAGRSGIAAHRCVGRREGTVEEARLPLIAAGRPAVCRGRQQDGSGRLPAGCVRRDRKRIPRISGQFKAVPTAVHSGQRQARR